ncbi:hypothetical protein MHYP_G00017090 [Metynnis hypsauchen]
MDWGHDNLHKVFQVHDQQPTWLIVRTHLYYCSAVRSLPLLDPQRYCTEPVCPRLRQSSRESSPQTFSSLFLMGLMLRSQDCWRWTKQHRFLGKKAALKGFLDTNEKRRTSALLGLPHYLSEEPASIKMCDAYGETLDVAMRGMQVGLLIGYEVQLDKHTPKTSSLFRTKRGAVGQRIRSQMLELIQDPSASVEERREVVLRRLMESMVERREELISDHHICVWVKAAFLSFSSQSHLEVKSRDEAEVHAKLSRCPMKM